MAALAISNLSAQNVGDAQARAIDCLGKLAAPDTISAVVKISVTATNPNVRLPADFENLFAQEFRDRFSAPKKLPLRVAQGRHPCHSQQCAGAVFTIGDVIYATAHANETLSDFAFVDPTLTPDLIDAAYAALRAMSDENAVPSLPTRSNIDITVQLTAEEKPDTVPLVRQLFKLRLPWYHAAFRDPQIPRWMNDPRYPPSAETAGLGDRVVAAFTVEPSGVVPKTSIEFLRGEDRQFIVSVWNSLQTTRYQPARLGECPVAARTEQAFQFKVEK